MATLSASELRKYDWRIPKFLERLASGTFITTSNTEVKLSYQGTDLEYRLKTESPRIVNKIKFVDELNTEYALSDLLKDEGFGGKNAQRREQEALSLLQQKIDIQKSFWGEACVPVVIDGICYYIAGVENTPGTPKSDFHFVDVEGKEIVWISHKHGKTARCFQQWGGCSEKVSPRIYNHEETQEFVAAIRAIEFAPGLTVAKNIHDPQLHFYAIYGNNFGYQYGPDNVQLVIQGMPSLSANTSNTHFDIVSHSVHTNGETLPEEYTPTFMAMYRTDRRDFKIPTCRVGISPKNARLISNWIDYGQSRPLDASRGLDIQDAGTTDAQVFDENGG